MLLETVDPVPRRSPSDPRQSHRLRSPLRRHRGARWPRHPPHPRARTRLPHRDHPGNHRLLQRPPFPTGRGHPRRKTPSTAETLIRHHLGICLDSCHAALQFEDPAESLRQYQTEGIRVPKIQISAALQTDSSPASLEALRPFAEPVYLHQVKAQTPTGEILGWPDLPQALAELPSTSASEVRVHFHVPLHFPGSGPLQSTASLLNPDQLGYLTRDPLTHLEIETYTWDVLPPSLRSTSIEKSIAAEFNWLHLQSLITP